MIGLDDIHRVEILYTAIRPKFFDTPAMGHPLTWQINNETPLRRWFETRAPHLERVHEASTRRLRPVVPRRRPDALPPWLIGMAFDWRLRIGIGLPDDPSATTAYAGWCQVRDVLVGHVRLTDAMLASDRMAQDRNPVAQLFDAARQARGGDDRPRDEMQLARIAVALARYESCYRGGVRPDDPLLPLGAAPDLPTLLALCPEAAADEIARLTAAARRGLAPLFPAESIELNPDFTAYGMPADGDLVIDGLLLDLKTVTRPEIQVDWLWQILGYVFLDEGRRGIDRVGLYLSRHAWLVTWDVDELLSALAGQDVTEAELRGDFLAALG